jgi:hypothetical protein
MTDEAWAVIAPLLPASGVRVAGGGVITGRSSTGFCGSYGPERRGGIYRTVRAVEDLS